MQGIQRSVSLLRVCYHTLGGFSVGLHRLGVCLDQAVMTTSPNHLFITVEYLATIGSRRLFSDRNFPPDLGGKPGLLLAHPNLLSLALEAAQHELFYGEKNLPVLR